MRSTHYSFFCMSISLQTLNIWSGWYCRMHICSYLYLISVHSIQHRTVVPHYYCLNPVQNSNPYWNWMADCCILLYLIINGCTVDPVIKSSDAILLFNDVMSFAHVYVSKGSDDWYRHLFDPHICHYWHSNVYMVVYCGVGIDLRSEWWTVGVP